MDGRPLSSRTAIDYAIQIASGLAAAHERGIVHRDIKPANLFVTTDGRVKILDFGLAKLIGPDALARRHRDGHASTARSRAGRRHGHYMSPEQARGLRVDHRSDIFSFGTVLYRDAGRVPTVPPQHDGRYAQRRSCTTNRRIDRDRCR